MSIIGLLYVTQGYVDVDCASCLWCM